MLLPPDYLPEETSGDTTVSEGGNVKLTCKAIGRPQPNVTWKREDGGDIIMKESSGHKFGGIYYKIQT